MIFVNKVFSRAIMKAAYTSRGKPNKPSVKYLAYMTETLVNNNFLNRHRKNHHRLGDIVA